MKMSILIALVTVGAVSASSLTHGWWFGSTSTTANLERTGDRYNGYRYKNDEIGYRPYNTDDFNNIDMNSFKINVQNLL